MGFALLLLRIGSRESTIFEKSQDLNISHGNFLQLITRKDLLLRYLKLILLGLPIFFVIGILVTATPEFARAFGMNEIPETGFAIMISYTFISLGDILCTFLSQLLKSRKKALAIFLWISLAGILVFLLFPGQTPLAYYWHCAIMGIGIGYLSLLVTFVSERFGTNLRATATISAPNFIRGLLPVFIAPIFLYIKSQSDLITAGVVMGILCTIIPMILLLWIKEDYGKSMDWVE